MSLHDAARFNILHLVQKLLAEGSDPNSVDERGWTAMANLRFIPRGKKRRDLDDRAQIIEELAKSGARFNSTDLWFLSRFKAFATLGPATYARIHEGKLNLAAAKRASLEEEELLSDLGAEAASPSRPDRL